MTRTWVNIRIGMHKKYFERITVFGLEKKKQIQRRRRRSWEKKLHNCEIANSNYAFMQIK